MYIVFGRHSCFIVCICMLDAADKFWQICYLFFVHCMKINELCHTNLTSVENVEHNHVDQNVCVNWILVRFFVIYFIEAIVVEIHIWTVSMSAFPSMDIQYWSILRPHLFTFRILNNVELITKFLQIYVLKKPSTSTALNSSILT